MLLPNQGSVMLCPLSKEGILYLGNLKLAVSVSWLLSGGQNSHILFFFFLGRGKPRCHLLARARLCCLCAAGREGVQAAQTQLQQTREPEMV